SFEPSSEFTSGQAFDSYSSPTTSLERPASAPRDLSVVSIQAHRGVHGEYLTDGRGYSLYVFQKDEVEKSHCTGECLKSWPPFLASAEHRIARSESVDRSAIGLIQREDGTQQLTFQGMPLYFFVGDREAGETKGHGIDEFGGQWSLVRKDGTRILGGEIPRVTNESLAQPQGSGELNTASGCVFDSQQGLGIPLSSADGESAYTGGYSSCGVYTCYTNGLCCDACGSCYYSSYYGGGGYYGGGYSYYPYHHRHHRHHRHHHRHHPHHGGRRR
ncbi:MAG: hypothetical protein ACO3A2_10430, partial [Bdellovibrionia bacterium]